MAGEAEVEARLIALETKVNGAVTLPIGSVDVNDTKVTDKTGWQVFGKKAGINGGLMFAGISLVANPSSNADIEEPFIFKDF